MLPGHRCGGPRQDAHEREAPREDAEASGEGDGKGARCRRLHLRCVGIRVTLRALQFCAPPVCAADGWPFFVCPTDYDGAHDEIVAEREKAEVAASTKAQAKKPVRYVHALLEKTQERKLDDERLFEKRLVTELKEEEKELGGASEKFVTAAYRAQLEANKKWEEEQRQIDMLKAKDDVTNKADLTDFYSNMLRGKNAATGGKAVRGASPPKDVVAEKQRQREAAAQREREEVEAAARREQEEAEEADRRLQAAADAAVAAHVKVEAEVRPPRALRLRCTLRPDLLTLALDPAPYPLVCRLLKPQNMR
jgi:hypothetical protein